MVTGHLVEGEVKMRIACLALYNLFNGAENMLVLAAKNLKARHDVWYCSPEGIINTYLSDADVTHISIAKVSIKTVKNLMKTLKPDIFLVLDNKASTICALAGVPFVSYQQNNWPFIAGFNPFSLGMLFYCKKALKVIGVSDHLIKTFRFSKYIHDKYTTIPNFVDLSNVKKLAGEIPQTKTYDFCFFGRLDHQKRPWMFLKIVKKMVETRPGTKVVIIGDGILSDETKAQAKKMDLLEAIEFTGFIRNPFEYVKKTKLLVMTSLYEGHCLAVTETLSLGLPVISARVPGLVDEIDDSCGILSEDDEEAFCKAITELLDNDELYRKKSQGAIVKSQRYGDIDKFVESIETVLLEAGEIASHKRKREK
jgi:glycosyltransferase involved in cell wall biosynthesis